MKTNMSIGTRILAGYGVVLLVVGTVGIVTYQATTELIASADLVEHSHQVKETIADLLSLMKDAETGQRGFLLTGEERYLEPYNSSIGEIGRKIQSLRDLTANDPAQQQRIDKIQPLIAGKLAELAKTISLRRLKGQPAAIEEVLTDRGKNLMDEARSLAGEMDGEANELLKQRDQSARSTANFARNAMILGGLLVLALVVTVGMLIRFSITRPLTVFMQFAGLVGEGDLTQQAKVSSGDELGQLALCLDQMVRGLREVAGQSRLATENLKSAAAEILASTQQQASGTSEQAAAIQQTTTTMEEVMQAGVQISERAKQVAASTEATSAASHAG
ncbi:MAG TPA: CHASE3 domain-containing protein, partial [Bryobacteraceae bacterium]|nr:CHASE3 domain-containing protein [Bryobacteraceae bacterium]